MVPDSRSLVSCCRRNGVAASDSRTRGHYLSKCTRRSPCGNRGRIHHSKQPGTSAGAYLYRLILIALVLRGQPQMYSV